MSIDILEVAAISSTQALLLVYSPSAYTLSLYKFTFDLSCASGPTATATRTVFDDYCHPNDQCTVTAGRFWQMNGITAPIAYYSGKQNKYNNGLIISREVQFIMTTDSS